MEEKYTSLFENGLIWFGAAVSIAEILTGTYFASLGFQKGLLAIVLGHIIGCGLMFLAGIIGGKTRKSAMETVKMSFGQKGSLLFAFLNVLQLVGWTGIMIYDGALAFHPLCLPSPKESKLCFPSPQNRSELSAREHPGKAPVYLKLCSRRDRRSTVALTERTPQLSP